MVSGSKFMVVQYDKKIHKKKIKFVCFVGSIPTALPSAGWYKQSLCLPHIEKEDSEGGRGGYLLQHWDEAWKLLVFLYSDRYCTTMHVIILLCQRDCGKYSVPVYNVLPLTKTPPTLWRQKNVSESRSYKISIEECRKLECSIPTFRLTVTSGNIGFSLCHKFSVSNLRL